MLWTTVLPFGICPPLSENEPRRAADRAAGTRPVGVIGEDAMRTLGIGGLAAILAAGLVVSAICAADDDDDDAPKKAPTWKFGSTGRFGKPTPPPPPPRKKPDPAKESVVRPP